MGFGRRDIDRMMKMENAVAPVSSVAATVLGAAFDRRSATGSGASAVLHVACGVATGSPSTQTVDADLQDSENGSTGWATIGGDTTTLTADNTASSGGNVNLVSAKKFVRAVIVVGFTAGSTPAIPISATICFGGRE